MTARSELPLSPGLARLFVGIEKYVLPCVYGFLAWRQWQAILQLRQAYRTVAAAPGTLPYGQEIYFTNVVRHGLLGTLLAFVGLALLTSRPPRELPDKLGQVLVPLAASFYFVLYGAADAFPPLLRENVFPARLQPAFALAGVGLSGLGYAVCLWALLHLRRSFALYVSVREIVTGGPYRYVRHPIYLGYFLDQAGLFLASGSLGVLLLGTGFVLFQVQRARMEEAKLAESSAAYRHYVSRTGFLLPRLRV